MISSARLAKSNTEDTSPLLAFYGTLTLPISHTSLSPDQYHYYTVELLVTKSLQFTPSSDAVARHGYGTAAFCAICPWLWLLFFVVCEIEVGLLPCCTHHRQCNCSWVLLQLDVLWYWSLTKFGDRGPDYDDRKNTVLPKVRKKGFPVSKIMLPVEFVAAPKITTYQHVLSDLQNANQGLDLLQDISTAPLR